MTEQAVQAHTHTHTHTHTYTSSASTLLLNDVVARRFFLPLDVGLLSGGGAVVLGIDCDSADVVGDDEGDLAHLSKLLAELEVGDAGAEVLVGE
jgi:hypothetical protein